MSEQVSAVVLAAGMARRMGAVKQLLPLRGKSVIEHVLDSVRASEAHEIVLVLGFAAEEIQARIALGTVKVIVNDAYREGMAASLRTGVAAIDPAASAALIVLADQPFVRPETINRLIIENRARRPLVAIPTYNGKRGNPVLISRSLFPDVMQLSGDTGCRALFHAYVTAIVEVAVDDPGILIDFDTREDVPISDSSIPKPDSCEAEPEA